jgi:RND family efflux transporter MFP subunit
MASASSSSSGDTLSRLKIQRDALPPRRSFLGRVFRGLFILLLLAGLLGGGVWLLQRQGLLSDWKNLREAVRGREEVRAAIVSAEKGRSADATVVATGYLESRQQARIGARATGRIEQVNVEEGRRVKRNDILAVLEHADLDAALAATKATVARAESELLEHEVEIARVKREFARAEKSLALKSMTPADYDQALYTRDAAIAKKVSLEAALQLAQARVAEAEQLRENMFVRAPFDGTVISKDAELGESIMPGGMGEASGRGSVVTIADLEHLEADCDVKEDFISRISAEQLSEVAVDAVPDRRYKGKVRKIIPMGDRARATVKVKVEILDADPRLFPDMSCTVYFLPDQSNSSTKQDQTRVFCAEDALVKSDKETFVWEVRVDDRLRKTVVAVGESKDGRVEVISGLTGGERVVLAPGEKLVQDQLVKVAQ